LHDVHKKFNPRIAGAVNPTDEHFWHTSCVHVKHGKTGC
jgi:hypothetical protein